MGELNKSGDVWVDAVRDYEKYLRGIGRPDTTIELRRNQLRYLAKSLNMEPAAITEKDLTDWFGLHNWRPETHRSYRSGIRGFFKWACKTGQVEFDPTAELPPVKVDISVPRPAPDAVWAVARLAANTRDVLMLRLAAEAGLRRSEIASVHTQDIRRGANGYQLLVHGKGRRERLVPLADDLGAAISAGPGGYTPGLPAVGWLFPGQHHGHLSPAWVGTLCSRLMPGIWTTHTLRHRFATRAYRGTKNIRAVQQLLGHSTVAMTERYTAVDDDEMRAAMQAAIMADPLAGRPLTA